MSKDEILCTRFGEMQDLIACHAISNGVVKEKSKHYTDFDTVLSMR